MSGRQAAHLRFLVQMFSVDAYAVGINVLLYSMTH
jgi:hypothetical protein